MIINTARSNVQPAYQLLLSRTTCLLRQFPFLDNAVPLQRLHFSDSRQKFGWMDVQSNRHSSSHLCSRPIRSLLWRLTKEIQKITPHICNKHWFIFCPEVKSYFAPDLTLLFWTVSALVGKFSTCFFIDIKRFTDVRELHERELSKLK